MISLIRRWSQPGKFAVWCVAAVLSGCGAARAQISPGALSRAHQQLTGITKCGSCHDFGARGFRCLECHTEIKQALDLGRGFHTRAYKSTAGETECAHCHVEHRGSNYALITLNRQDFDHPARTGFALDGRHRKLQCQNCHTAGKIGAAPRAEIKIKDLNRTFLGLRRECTSCHQEPHQNQLGLDCLRCHDQQAWKPASRFDHARAPFPLTGLHRQVSCERCHARPDASGLGATPAAGQPPQKLVLFRLASFESCVDCHKDPHRGAFQEVRLSGRCDGCHNTGGWKNDRPARDFNHDITEFRLTGKHAEVTCGKCHKEGDFRRPVAHKLCQDCHQDPHEGQFAAREAGSDCSACHVTANFKPSLFDREAHMKSAFPLEGKHSSLGCLKCHQPEGREARYRTGKLACAACHTEPHGGEFVEAPYGNKCDHCHTGKGFAPTTFTVERHGRTRFPLTGRHNGVECGKCHKPLVPEASSAAPGSAAASSAVPALAVDGNNVLRVARRQYRFASLECSVCHADPHRISPKANVSCETCHATQAWKELRPFDHSVTRFKLDGSHVDGVRQPIACSKCHKTSGEGAGAPAGIAPVLSGIPAQCSSCHSQKDAHGGQFSGTASRPEDCSYCHITVRWNGTDFDHDRARFALSAVHRKVACAKCHKEQKEVNGKPVRLYRDTPADCIKCH